jgi:hypothetical protein
VKHEEQAGVMAKVDAFEARILKHGQDEFVLLGILPVHTLYEHEIRLNFSVRMIRSTCIASAPAFKLHVLVDRKFSSHKKFLCLANTEIWGIPRKSCRKESNNGMAEEEGFEPPRPFRA